MLFLSCSGEAYVHVPTPAVGASLPENPAEKQHRLNFNTKLIDRV